MTEREESLALARRLLDEPGADPDDDLRVLARQLIRATESDYEPTEDDVIAFIKRTAEAEGFGVEWDRVSRVPYSTRGAVAKMMLAFRSARWVTRPCLACGKPSTELYQGRPDFPTCGNPKCELKMRGGIDAADKGANR